MSKTITKEEFDSRYVKYTTVVYCPTKELAEEFLTMADKFGYKWWTGYRYIDDIDDIVYESNYCYYIKEGDFSSKDFYFKKGYDIIEFDGFKEHKDKNEDIFKVIIKLVDEDIEHHLITHKDKMQKSLNILADQRYKDVFFEAIDGSIFYTKKDYIGYVKTEVL